MDRTAIFAGIVFDSLGLLFFILFIYAAFTEPSMGVWGMAATSLFCFGIGHFFLIYGYLKDRENPY